MRPLIACLVLSCTLPLAAQQDLVVHEWGTFTSVAGPDGRALRWRPLLVDEDLPSFVHSASQPNQGLRYTLARKELMSGLVRMETPVLYFYAPEEMAVEVRVDFPSGAITEWYPHARALLEHGIDWGQVLLQPGVTAPLPHEEGGSHYYAARETAADLVRVCGDNKATESEKFLFYRGIGNFDLGLEALVEGDAVLLRPQQAFGEVLIFERRGDWYGMGRADLERRPQRVPRPELDLPADDLEPMLAALRARLLAEGLFAPEVEAMLATWRDSWFEDGLRVMAVLPTARTEALLPLTLDPAPSECVRVLVARLELISPEQQQALCERLAQAPDLEAGRTELRRFGRFAEPVLQHLLPRVEELGDPHLTWQVQSLHRQASEAMQP